ncbi:hypothetical protein UlMin_024995 [Ulmus minor]
MDHYEGHGQRRDIKHKGRNVVWSIAMEKCLIEALAIQARNGNKIDKCFNENAYSATCIAMNSRFNLNLNNQKVIMKDMLSQDGFEWNPNTKMVECDSDDLWKRYISAHPNARQFRGKQIEMYDELKILKDGSFQTEMKNCEDDSASFLSPSSEDVSETDGTDQEPPLVPHLRQLPKRPRSSEALQDAMLAVASSIRRLADAMERSKCSIDASELFQAVMEIDGLEEAKQMYAFEYLNADPVKARAFLTYNPRMRKIYLFRQFWWWK